MNRFVKMGEFLNWYVVEVGMNFVLVMDFNEVFVVKGWIVCYDKMVKLVGLVEFNVSDYLRRVFLKMREFYLEVKVVFNFCYLEEFVEKVKKFGFKVFFMIVGRSWRKLRGLRGV